MPRHILDLLIDKTADPNPDVSEDAMLALANNRITDPRFIAALIANLDNPALFHQPAARVLANMGAEAKPAEAALRRLLARNDDTTAQAFARHALKNLGSP